MKWSQRPLKPHDGTLASVRDIEEFFILNEYVTGEGTAILNGFVTAANSATKTSREQTRSATTL